MKVGGQIPLLRWSRRPHWRSPTSARSATCRENRAKDRTRIPGWEPLFVRAQLDRV